MRLSALICLSVLGLSACQTHTISESSQELARLQQDRARLNRVYATAETTILEQQKTDAAYAAARTHFQILRQLRFKACANPASPNPGFALAIGTMPICGLKSRLPTALPLATKPLSISATRGRTTKLKTNAVFTRHPSSKRHAQPQFKLCFMLKFKLYCIEKTHT